MREGEEIDWSGERKGEGKG